jgi:nitrite reductase/ring-hydroxylating ferredoxin subunit/uncharacterized membrane protein
MLAVLGGARPAMARWLTRLMDAQDAWVKPLGTWAHGLLHRFFSWIPGFRDLLIGKWLGHPVHPALTDAPIGMLFLVIVFDVSGHSGVSTIALVIGILAMLAAAVVGFADYADTDGFARDRATLHSSLMVVALLLYVLSLVMRFGDNTNVAAIWVSVLAFLVLIAGAFVGGDVVYVAGNMVSRHAFRGSGTKWIALEPAEVDAAGMIPEGKPVKAKLGINTLVLIREGANILALHDTCAHAGGPLSGGTYEHGVIECPWHASRYRMADGHVVRGPSVYDQPAYEVRAREGGGWEARRSG